MATTQKRPARTTKVSKEKLTDEYGHLQPQAPELEKAVLGALMIEKDAYSLVSEILKPESFYEHRHQLIYAAITDLAIQQKPIDLLTVTEHLRFMGNLDEVGGPFYITQLSGMMASSAHIEYHARIIAQKYLAHQNWVTHHCVQHIVQLFDPRQLYQLHITHANRGEQRQVIILQRTRRGQERNEVCTNRRQHRMEPREATPDPSRGSWP